MKDLRTVIRICSITNEIFYGCLESIDSNFINVTNVCVYKVDKYVLLPFNALLPEDVLHFTRENIVWWSEINQELKQSKEYKEFINEWKKNQAEKT